MTGSATAFGSGYSIGDELTSLHLKPQDDYNYFKGLSTFDSDNPVGQDLWEDINPACFAPTQVCVSFKRPVTEDTTVDAYVRVKGIDQFGYPATELLWLHAVNLPDPTPLGAVLWARVGTKRCYTRIESMLVETTSANLTETTYRIGIGRSRLAAQGNLDNSYRLPTPLRLRHKLEVTSYLVVMNYVEHSLPQTLTEQRMWVNPSGIVKVDRPNNAVEVVISDDLQKHFSLILNRPVFLAQQQE